MPELKPENERFTDWLLSDITGTTQALGYTPTRFLQMVQEHGGVGACKILLRPNVPASFGFCRLHNLGRLDLSVEHIALMDQWTHLIDDAERQAAQFRIDNAEAICSTPGLVGE